MLGQQLAIVNHDVAARGIDLQHPVDRAHGMAAIGRHELLHQIGEALRRFETADGVMAPSSTWVTSAVA